MSALGRHRNSILDLQSFHKGHENDLNEKDAVVSDEDDEMSGFFVDDHDDHDPDNDDEMFGVFIDEEDEFTNEFTHTLPLDKAQIPKKGILKQAVKPRNSGGNDKQRRGLRGNRKSSGSLTALSMKKNVRFSTEDHVHEVMSLEPYFCDVWWDHDDYDDFRKTSTFLAHAIPNGDAIKWMNGSHVSEPPPEYAHDINSDINTVCEKWWCKFGHSRRGLEHMCCEQEAMTRRKKVEGLMKALLNEQYKQELKRRRGKDFDHLAIARVSLLHTKWARDLAQAAGLADANAVATDFDEEVKKNRDDFVHMVRSNSDNGKIMGKSLSSVAMNKMKKITSIVKLHAKG